LICVADRPGKSPIDQRQVDEPKRGAVRHDEMAHGIVSIQRNTSAGCVQSRVRRNHKRVGERDGAIDPERDRYVIL
jgi:hypothetical protein